MHSSPLFELRAPTYQAVLDRSTHLPNETKEFAECNFNLIFLERYMEMFVFNTPFPHNAPGFITIMAVAAISVVVA